MSNAFFRPFLGFRSARNGDPVPPEQILVGESSSFPVKAGLLWPRGTLCTAPILLGLLAAAVAGGCGSSGPPVAINLSPSSAQSVQQGQTVSIAATIANDVSSKGVTWSLSGSGCTGAACGSLTNQTPMSVTYNAPTRIPSNLIVTVTATSVAEPLKSASVTIIVPATVVTIQNKLTELAAGTVNSSFFFAQFRATIQNDPTNSGVTWTLTANGTACSPACGTLSFANPYSVTYTPPASVPAAPDNMPTITATSVSSSARSDTDTFTIFDGSAACGTGGNESLLNGQYAIMLQGWTGSGAGTPMIYAASFGADGTGKVTGGEDQVNYFNHSARTAGFVAEEGAGIVPLASSYSVGSDGRGCLTLTDQFAATFTLRFSLGGVSGGIASKGDIIFFNQQSATPERASGILRRQDPTAFSLSALAPNYALGVDGWENSKGSLAHYALVGSFAQSGGTLSSPSFDANDGGTYTLMNEPGVNSGTIQPISTGTGVTTATVFLPGAGSVSVSVEIYVINSSELFFVSNQISPDGAVFGGRAIATSNSFNSSSISPNFIFRFTGSSSGAASVSIGLASFSSASTPGISGTVSGTMDQYAGGAVSSQNLAGTYALTPGSGRLGITGASAATSPICYLTTPLDGVSAFCISMDPSASLGVFDAQPAATYSSSSLSGSFFFGITEPGDNTVPGLSGVASISSGSLTGMEEASTPQGMSPGFALSRTLSINADGSGNLGSNTVAVTNGAVLYFIDETGNLPPLVQVFEP
jgi:hypothetical protein